MPERQRKGKRVGLHSAVFPKVGLQTQVLPTACTGKSLANCESQAKGFHIESTGAGLDESSGNLLVFRRAQFTTTQTAEDSVFLSRDIRFSFQLGFSHVGM